MQRLLMVGMVAAGLISVSPSFGETQKDKVLSYLKKNVIGRTVSAKQSDEESDFSQSWTYSDLVETKNGFMFEETVEIKQSVYALDENGKRKGAPVVRDRKNKAHTEVQLITSQDRLRGYKRMVSSDFNDATGKAYNYEITATENGLETKWTDIHPNEWPAEPPKEGMNLLSSSHTEKLSVNDAGKLVREFGQETSILDPKTEEVVSKKKPWSTKQIEE